MNKNFAWVPCHLEKNLLLPEFVLDLPSGRARRTAMEEEG
jgi:hypothetical protein